MPKQKILIVSDIPLHPSGVGGQCKHLCKKLVQSGYEVVSVGMLNIHTEPQQPIMHRFDSGEVIKMYAVPKPNPNGPVVLNNHIFTRIYELEKPDCLIMFQDPYKFDKLWQFLPTIRTKIPVYFVSVWDTYLLPQDNGPAHYLLELYENIDRFGVISRQSQWFTDKVFDKIKYGKKPVIEWVGHGEDPNIYRPLQPDEYKETKAKQFQGKEFDFVALIINNNQGRKKIIDLIEGFRLFTESLPKEQADKCALVIHASAITMEGTDLTKVIPAMAPNCNIFLNVDKVPEPTLNEIINCCDVFCAVSNAEGYGLTSNAAILAGKPALINTTGGLVDQCGFVDDNGKPIEWSLEYKNTLPNIKHGEWCYPIFPQRTIIGNPITLYLYDENAAIEDITKGLQYWYNVTPEQRKLKGLAGREYLITSGQTNTGFATRTVKAIAECINQFQPQPNYNLYKL